MRDFPITLIGDPGHAGAQRKTVARLLRRCPQCASKVNAGNVGYSDGTCDWCRGEGDYVS